VTGYAWWGEIDSDIGISVSLISYKGSNKYGTFSRQSLFHFELKLPQALYYPIVFSLIEYTIIKNNLLEKNAHAHARTN